MSVIVSCLNWERISEIEAYCNQILIQKVVPFQVAVSHPFEWGTFQAINICDRCMFGRGGGERKGLVVFQVLPVSFCITVCVVS
jgi:hypothetical protein